ncbi:3-methyl-2-oxobutanoate hydroxymethyltransferase [Kribbia dieselivorans]|uniref:3-methyl-2-oxobutanoate hydroxymethyltransferase n=1 Tax=Kribbia dieselivorans TaxID=331526 RepID=UPI00083989DD|nr:3-methyl-2-oxobutanoate hydroxymethyltransferase [Kribbia dieselivorans]
MSTRPRPDARPRTTLPGLRAKKQAGEKVVMVTAYDYPAALAADEAGIDLVLVGDSGAMTVLGYDSTVPVSVEEMLMLTAAVRRGLTSAFLVADLPFGSYEISDAQAVATALRFVKEAGADAVKLEGGAPMQIARVEAIIAAGIPVMGHVGLTPQTATALGGYKAQGRSAAAAQRVTQEALALQAAGCFAIVFEAIPADLSAEVMPAMDTAVIIGIGAGASTDGQVLVFHDLLGLGSGGAAKFVKRYADLHTATLEGLEAYASEVRAGSYPAAEHTYAMDPQELSAFRAWHAGR